MLQARKIKDNIYWVGAVDYTVRSFHGYSTPMGTTYNAYLILDKKITLIDTVKESFAEEMLQRIQSVVDPKKIEIILSNHAEFDHSGALRKIYDICHAEIYATAAGVKTLELLYGDMQYRSVTPDEPLKTGKYSFFFLPTPMVHWPDNMATWLPEERILFSNDAFGQHLASSTRFDTDTLSADVLREAKKYFANIVLPYAPQVKKALDCVRDLHPEQIAPAHGVLWSKRIPDVLALYDRLCSAEKDGSAVVVYDSMWGNTHRLALQVGARFEQKGIPVTYADLKTTHISDVLTHLCTASYLAVGSPTLNNTVMPNVAAFLNYCKGLRPTGLKYIAFGTYGWAGGAVREICAALDALQYEKLAEYSFRFLPQTLPDLAV